MNRKLELYVQVVDIARALCIVADDIARNAAVEGADVRSLMELRHALENNARELADSVRNEGSEDG